MVLLNMKGLIKYLLKLQLVQEPVLRHPKNGTHPLWSLSGPHHHILRQGLLNREQLSLMLKIKINIIDAAKNASSLTEKLNIFFSIIYYEY